MHRSPLKLVINPILRFLQFWTDEPWVLGSETEFDENKKPHFQGYCWLRAKVLADWKDVKKGAKRNL